MVKTKLKKLIAILMALLMCISCCGCDTYNNFRAAFIDKNEDVPVIKIGVFEPTTGTDAEAAAEEIKGIELAHKLYSSVLDSKIELVYGDNQSDVSVCESVAQSLIDDGVSVVLGSYKSVLTLAASDTFKNASMPAITATNTNPLITQTSDWYFRVCYIDSYQGDAAAEYTYKMLGQEKAAVLVYEGNDYNSALAAEYIDAMEQMTGTYDCVTTIVLSESTDFSELANEIIASESQAIFFPSSIEEATGVIDAVSSLGLALHWIGTSQWDGIMIDGVSYTLDYDPNEDTSSMSTTFQAAYKEEYGENEVPSDSAALGFDSYILALAAIRIAGEGYTGETLKDALYSVQGLSGATGSISISSTGDPVKDIIVEQIANGEAVAIYTAHPSVE